MKRFIIIFFIISSFQLVKDGMASATFQGCLQSILNLTTTEKNSLAWINYLIQMSEVENWHIKNFLDIFHIPDAEIMRVHNSLMNSNAIYKAAVVETHDFKFAQEIFTTGLMNGRSADSSDGVDQIRLALFGVCTKLQINPFDATDPSIIQVGNMLKNNQQFRTWSLNRKIESNWNVNPAVQAKKMLNEWEANLVSPFSDTSIAWVNHLDQVRKNLIFGIDDIANLFRIPDAEIMRIHNSLMNSNAIYKAAVVETYDFKFAQEIFKTGLMNGRSADSSDGVDQIRGALYGVCTKLQINPFMDDPSVILAGDMIGKNPQFRVWALSRKLESNWKVDSAVEAKKMLHEWENEVKFRYIPKPAFPGKNFVNQVIESQATQAQIGRIRYYASEDGKTWVAASGQDDCIFPVLPRWDGQDPLKFESYLDDAKNSVWQKEVTKKYLSDSQKRWQNQVEPQLVELAPTSDQQAMENYQDGKFHQHRFIHPPKQVEEFIATNAWGYHILDASKLEEISIKGWIPNLLQTAESSGVPGLHLSTHLGLNFPIAGKKAVVRVRLDKEHYRAATAFEWHGHIIRDSNLSATDVQNGMEFSVDEGVTWFPMRPKLIRAAEEGLLPTKRGIPLE